LGYTRVSSDEQAASGLGLEAQRQRILDYCGLKQLGPAEIFEDAGVSGGKPLGTRPAGARLLAQAHKGEAVVIVAKLDRVFRSTADAATTIADFDQMRADPTWTTLHPLHLRQRRRSGDRHQTWATMSWTTS